MNTTPRKPTEEELRIIASLTCEDGPDEAEYIASRPVAVFDNYISDGPGYTGTVAIVVWGEPQIISMITFGEAGPACVTHGT